MAQRTTDEVVRHDGYLTTFRAPCHLALPSLETDIKLPAITVLTLACVLLLAGCGSSSSDAASHQPTDTNVPVPATLEPGAPAPPGLSCAGVGGVFVAHGTDGRGDCMSADPRLKCHVAPADQDGNYLAEFTMTPPFPNGTIDNPELIGMASNKDCWKQLAL